MTQQIELSMDEMDYLATFLTDRQDEFVQHISRYEFDHDKSPRVTAHTIKQKVTRGYLKCIANIAGIEI